jgi:hypothetical protein
VGVLGHKVSTEINCTFGTLTWLLVSLTKGGFYIRAAACNPYKISTPGPEPRPLAFFWWWYIDDDLSCLYPCTNLTIQKNTDEYTDIILKHHLINTIYHTDTFLPSKGRPQPVRLINLNSKVNKIRILHLAIHVIYPVTEMSTRNISWGQRWPVRRADNLTTFMCRLS